MNRIREDAFYREKGEKMSEPRAEWDHEFANEQATDERTLDNASSHIIWAVDRLDLLFRAADQLKDDGGRTITLDGPLFDLTKEAHDSITKAYNTVRYLQETK